MLSNNFYKDATEGPKVSIIARSRAPSGVEIVSFQLNFWNAILPEMLTHRALSRSVSSLRAEPVAQTMRRASEQTTLPVHWGKAQKGMQADDRLRNEGELRAAKALVREGLRKILPLVKDLVETLELHKQISNRYLSPYLSSDAIVTATDWENFFALRCHTAAEPHIRILAWRMADLYYKGEPAQELKVGEWHLPYIAADERQAYDLETLKRCSAARCARVSYRTHDGQKPSVEKDLELFNRLQHPSQGDSELEPAHNSPLEHQATPLEDPSARSGNFRGWHQFRQEVPRSVMRFDYEAAVRAGWRDVAYECLEEKRRT